LRFFRGSSLGKSTPYDVRLANATNTFVGNIQLGDPVSYGPAVLGIASDGALGNPGNTVTLGGRFFDGESNRTAFGGLRAWSNLSLAASRVIQQSGRSFQLLLTGGGIFGQFANAIDGGRRLTADGAGSFVVHYGGNQPGLLLSEFTAAAVPEPASYALLLLGLLVIGTVARHPRVVNRHPQRPLRIDRGTRVA